MDEVDRPRGRSLLARVFTSPDEPRPRAGWRLLLQLLLTVVLIAVGLIAVSAGAASAGQSAPQALLLFVQLLGMTAAVYLARRFLDRRSFGSLGLRLDRHTLRDLLFGIAVAGVMMGLVYGVEAALGWVRFEAYAWEQQPPLAVLREALASLVVYTFVGWQEELFSRGYWLQNIAAGLSLPWGVFLSSAVFALLHLANPSVSLTAIVGLFAAGVFLAYGYLLTRQLWLPIGVHIGWNYFEGTVFGFPVSGTGSFRLIRQAVEGPEVWTGGAFGPEAGLIILPAMLVGAGLIYWYVRRFTAPRAAC